MIRGTANRFAVIENYEVTKITQTGSKSQPSHHRIPDGVRIIKRAQRHHQEGRMEESRPKRNARPPPRLLDYVPTFTTTSSEDNSTSLCRRPGEDNIADSNRLNEGVAKIRHTLQNLDEIPYDGLPTFDKNDQGLSNLGPAMFQTNRSQSQYQETPLQQNAILRHGDYTSVQRDETQTRHILQLQDNAIPRSSSTPLQQNESSRHGYCTSVQRDQTQTRSIFPLQDNTVPRLSSTSLQQNENSAHGGCTSVQRDETQSRQIFPLQDNETRPSQNCITTDTIRPTSVANNFPVSARPQDANDTWSTFRGQAHGDGGQHQRQLGPNEPQWHNPAQQWPHYNQQFAYASQASVDRVNNEIQLLRDTVEKEMRKLRRLYERELSPDFPSKPNSLPLSSLEEVMAFENIPEKEYRSIVSYLGSLGGHNLTEAANEVLKNAMKDSVSPGLTWHGRKQNGIALRKTRFAKALYASVARNRTFDKPSWSEFMDGMVNALRSSKQRHRNSLTRVENENRNRRHGQSDNEHRRNVDRGAPTSRNNVEANDSDDTEIVDEIAERRDRGRQNNRIRRERSSPPSSGTSRSPNRQ